MSSLPSATSGTEGGPATFAASELAIVLSHFDLGVIDAIQPFVRGSRRAPKLLIRSERGGFLLKRRAEGRDDPERVALAHGVQRHLASRGFPVASLITTRRHQGTIILHAGRVYELFAFVTGAKYDQSLAATREAGSALALLHTLLRDFAPGTPIVTTSYHRLPQIPAQLPTLCERLDPRLRGTGEALARAYQEAADRVEGFGFATWPSQMVHGDWHPGNMLFSGTRVAAVLDFDTVRREPRAIDVANGALQFSITRLGENPEVWPSELDETRFKSFLEGYDSMSPAGAILSRAELGALAWLMVEAMVAEAFVPVAATGRFGPIPGGAFLRMVERKVEWLTRNHELLSRVAG